MAVRTIPFGLALKLSAFLLVADGLAALFLASVLSAPATAGVALAFAATWWADRVRPRLGPRAVTLMGVALMIFLAIDLAFVADSFFDGIVHLLVLLLLYKLATWQSARDVTHLGILSFFLLVAASAVTLSVGFLAIFVAFLVLGTWTFTLLHLRREAEVFSPGAATALEAAHVVTPGFVLICSVFSLAALLLTTAIFFALPRVGRAFLPLQAKTGVLTTGFTDRVELGTPGNIQTDPTVVMRVHLPEHPEGAPPPERFRWRGLAFDHFDGTTWSASNPARRPLPRRPDGAFLLRRPEPGRLLTRQEVELEPLGTEVLFAAPRLVALEGLTTGLLTDEAGAALLPQRSLVRLRYTAYSMLAAGPGTGGEDVLPAALAQRYLQTPPAAPRVAALAQQLTEGARAPLEVAQRLEAGLRRGYRYSLTLQRDRRLDPIEDFLFQQQAGHCEYFAASMVVMLRLRGVPSRVVTGFQAGDWNEYGRYFTVRQRDAHAWVEAFMPGTGWVTFDPSPRAEFDDRLGQAAGRLTRFLDFVKTRWTRYVVEYSLRDQVQAAQALRQRAGWVRESVGSTLGGWTGRFGPPAGAWRWLGMAAILAGGAVFLLVGRGGPRGRAGRRGGTNVHFFARLQRTLGRRGLVAAAGETPLELALRAAAAAPNLAPAEEITRLYYRVRFGAQPLAPHEAARVEAQLAVLERPQR